MGLQDAEDSYDVVEAIAVMSWSNGKVGMAGNSALAFIQWHVACLRPPHIAAIASWEGSGDIYREQTCRGGMFSMSNLRPRHTYYHQNEQSCWRYRRHI
jgi:putative CocE/NonD family hydrolase